MHREYLVLGAGILDEGEAAGGIESGVRVAIDRYAALFECVSMWIVFAEPGDAVACRVIAGCFVGDAALRDDLVVHGYAVRSACIGGTEMAHTAAISLHHPHAGTLFGVVDQHRVVVDEEHVMEMKICGDDSPLLTGVRVEDCERCAEGVAEDVMMVWRPMEAASLGVDFALGQQRAELDFVDVDVGEPAPVGRERRLTDRHLSGWELCHGAVGEARDIGAADLMVLEVVNFAREGMDCRQVIVDAVEVPLAPDGPASVVRVTIGQLTDLARCEVQAIELHLAAALAVKDEVATIRRDRGREVVESVGIGAAVGQPCDFASGVRIGFDRPLCLRNGADHLSQVSRCSAMNASSVSWPSTCRTRAPHPWRSRERASACRCRGSG